VTANKCADVAAAHGLRLPDGLELLGAGPGGAADGASGLPGVPEDAGIVLITREGGGPAAGGGDPERFRTTVVLTEQSTGGLGFRDWQAGTDELLPRVLPDYLVVDLEKVTLDGHPGGRRLAHHAGPRGEALTMEQWFTEVDGVGHTLTVTIETWRYDALADTYAAVAAAWTPGRPVDAGAGDAAYERGSR
jgi:hypothetical protein